jgi:molybdopterin-binding protein
VAGDTTVVEPGQEVYACVRAADVVVERPGRSSDSARNHLHGTIKLIDREGAVDRLIIDCGFDLAALVTTRSREELDLHEGRHVMAAIKATAVHLVPKA